MLLLLSEFYIHALDVYSKIAYLTFRHSICNFWWLYLLHLQHDTINGCECCSQLYPNITACTAGIDITVDAL